MFRLTTQRILIKNSAYPQAQPFLKINNFAFISKKKYTPMMPIIGNSSVIYIDRNYQRGGILEKRSLAFFSIPALLLSIHNYLTQWTILSGAGVGLLFILGYAAWNIIYMHIGSQVQAVQISSDAKKLYLTVPKDHFTTVISTKYLKPHPFSLLLKDMPKNLNEPTKFRFYVPFQYGIIKNGLQFQSIVQLIEFFDSKLFRLELDIEKDINYVRFEVKDDQKQAIENDKERLTQAEFFRKYENSRLTIMTNIPYQTSNKSLKETPCFPFAINLSQNSIKKYQDYLLAMAMNCQLTPQTISEQNDKSKSQDE